MRDDHLDRLLREAHQIQTGAPADPYSAEAERILHQAKTPTRRRNAVPNRRLRLVLAILALAIASVAAGWLVLRPVEQQAVTCLAAVDLDADRVGVIPTGVPSTADCGPAWLDGTLANPALAPGEVPDLVGCYTAGRLVVIPSDDPTACFVIDAEPAEPDAVVPEVVDVAAAQAAVDEWTDGECRPIPDAVSFAHDVRDQHLPEWAINVVDRPADWCAAFGLDPATDTITVAGYPPPE